jgi:hypothetical protein
VHQAFRRFWNVTPSCDLWTIKRISCLETYIYYLSTRSNSFTDMAVVTLFRESKVQSWEVQWRSMNNRCRNIVRRGCRMWGEGMLVKRSVVSSIIWYQSLRRNLYSPWLAVSRVMFLFRLIWTVYFLIIVLFPFSTYIHRRSSFNIGLCCFALMLTNFSDQRFPNTVRTRSNVVFSGILINP